MFKVLAQQGTVWKGPVFEPWHFHRQMTWKQGAIAVQCEGFLISAQTINSHQTCAEALHAWADRCLQGVMRRGDVACGYVS